MTPWKSCWRWTWRSPSRCCCIAARRWQCGRRRSRPATCGAARGFWESAFASAASREPMKMFGMSWWVLGSVWGCFFWGGVFLFISVISCVDSCMFLSPGSGAEFSCIPGRFEAACRLHYRSGHRHDWGACLRFYFYFFNAGIKPGTS